MNLLDLGIIVLLGLITVRGYYRGLFQELAVLGAMVAIRTVISFFLNKEMGKDHSDDK